jgi:hypothetical protein
MSEHSLCIMRLLEYSESEEEGEKEERETDVGRKKAEATHPRPSYSNSGRRAERGTVLTRASRHSETQRHRKDRQRQPAEAAFSYPFLAETFLALKLGFYAQREGLFYDYKERERLTSPASASPPPQSSPSHPPHSSQPPKRAPYSPPS